MFSGKSLFENTDNENDLNKITFEESDIVFVADIFIDEYAGGAELSTHALFKTSPYKTFKLKCNELTNELIQQGIGKTWVFFNFGQIDKQLIPFIVANCYYFVVEYDYKFCSYRSIELHKNQTGSDCNCHVQMHGKIISAFFTAAEKIFWMSKQQHEIYCERFPFLNNEKSIILSSIFDVKDLEYIEKLHQARKKNGTNGKWAIIGSNSWIKGVEQSKKKLEEFLEEDQSYDILSGLNYNDLLRTLSTYEGLCFMPLGGDTCPRIVIEANLLGLELYTNDNIQHASEQWWGGERDEVEDYLLGRHDIFWNEINSFHNREIKLSGYTTIKNVIKSNYPWRASIESLLSFCDEVIVLDGGSNDGSYEKMLQWAKNESKLHVKQIKRDWEDPKFALFDGGNKAIARTLCTGDWCWQQDVDEIVHEDDSNKIKILIRQLPKVSKLICLPVIEYWGSNEKVRIDVNPWKWRLSRNDSHITHGIPVSHRRYDSNGNLFSIGSDGCDYIRPDNYKPIEHVNFYTPELHNVRIHALQNNEEALSVYENYMNKVVNQLPCVYHYSWFDIERKIYTYKNYWSKHWMSLYNKKIIDIPENNMFFDKMWSEVSDSEINELAERMKNELGGWVFHKRIDFSKPTPWIKINKNEPEVIKAWVKNHGEV